MSYNRDSDEEFNKCLTVYGDNKMKEAEQIEVLRKQFESEFDDVSQKYDSGIYRNAHRESMWQGFLMAKRSQPVIELPEPEDMYDKGDMWLGRFIADGYVYNAIIAAGCKCKFKE